MNNINDFFMWEQISRDSIDVKRIYIDIAGDLIAGILLSQIIYWNLPNQEGRTKLRVKKHGKLWLAKGRSDWWEECRITDRQFDRAIKILEEKFLVEKKVFKFNGNPTLHIRLNYNVLMQCLSDFTESVKTKECDKHWLLHKTLKPNHTLCNNDIDESVISITENTTENTNRDMILNQVIVKSSQKEENNQNLSTDTKELEREKKEIKQRQDNDMTLKQNTIENLKKEKEILKQQKQIEELKQQINKLKQDQEEKKETEITDLHKYDFYKDLIKKNIDYNWIYNNFALAEKPNRETNSIDDYKLYKEKQDFIKLLDTFLDIMAEVMASNKKTIKINQEEIGQALVSKKFEQLTQGQIFFAVRQYQEYAQKTEVKYPKSYILTCLYNATTEQVAKDFTL